MKSLKFPGIFIAVGLGRGVTSGSSGWIFFMSRQPWRIADLIDLEFFFSRDEGEDLELLAARDRQIFSTLADAEASEKTSTSSLLYNWLVARRKVEETSHQELPLPGRIWQELFTLFFWGCLLAGLFSGATLAFSFLSYSGTKPVNVSSYFGIFVVLQLILFFLLILLFLYRHMLGQGLESSFLYSLLRRLFDKGLSGISRRAVARSGADSRLKWTARIAGAERMQQRYGVLFARPFSLLGQLFGVSFNVGVLATTLLKVIGSDIAFGWQTTLQVGIDAVYTLVQWISLPWSWLLPSYGCPSPEQIEGSRLILKEGIYYLANKDLASWWPFLCLSVLFYGLLPRLALLLGGVISQRRDLAALDFDHGRYRQLIHRMRTPLVSTRAPEEQQPQQSYGVTREPVMPAAEEREQAGPADRPSLIAMVPDELFNDCPRVELRQQVRDRLGYDLEDVLPIWTMEQTEEEELAVVQEKMAAFSGGDILLLQEAWQPPIQELLSFLQLLRETVGRQPTVIIGLIGKPAADTILTPVQPQNMQIWQQKIAAHADPGLQLVELMK